MSKYKLIKKYPCLPDSWYVGIIVTKKYDSVYSTDTSGVTCVNLCKEQVENYPEFWEKVVEKDYEILSFISNLTGSINIKKENGKFSAENYHLLGYYEESIYLSSNDYKIHSIKRLSDGEIFTIGDVLIDSCNTKHGKFQLNEIKFEIAPADKGTGKLTFIHDHPILGKWIPLENLQKVKQPLFKTENGIDIYEGDIIHWVNTYDYNYLYPLPFSTKAVELLNADSIYKVFSSRELAEDWLIFNKPCLSIKEITLAIGEKWVSDILEKVVKNKI